MPNGFAPQKQVQSVSESGPMTQDRDLWKKTSHVSAHSAVGGDGKI